VTPVKDRHQLPVFSYGGILSRAADLPTAKHSEVSVADEKKKPKEADLGEHKVHVTVEPQDGASRSEGDANKKAAQKVKDQVKEQVTKEIERRKGDGAKKQLDAVDDVADAAKKGVSPRTVKHVEVKVDGKTTDGDEVTRRKKVVPQE
jgi:hypothetical protein